MFWVPTYDFNRKICGYYPWALVMDLNKNNSFKCAVKEIDNPEDDNENTDSLNCDFFWNTAEMNIASKAFPNREVKAFES